MASRELPAIEVLQRIAKGELIEGAKPGLRIAAAEYLVRVLSKKE